MSSPERRLNFAKGFLCSKEIHSDNNTDSFIRTYISGCLWDLTSTDMLHGNHRFSSNYPVFGTSDRSMLRLETSQTTWNLGIEYSSVVNPTAVELHPAGSSISASFLREITSKMYQLPLSNDLFSFVTRGRQKVRMIRLSVKGKGEQSCIFMAGIVSTQGAEFSVSRFRWR